jgi:hypothetical protein
MIVVGRHPQCDARLDSLRVSRHHCCMTQDHGEVVIRDLGSTNGIRINGQRVEFGRLRPGDELSIAHIRYRLDNGQAHEPTLVDSPREAHLDRESPEMAGGLAMGGTPHGLAYGGAGPLDAPLGDAGEHRLAAAVRVLEAALPDRCRVQVIVQVPNEVGAGGGAAAAVPAENRDACRPDLSP